jgi:hypothetical protein
MQSLVIQLKISHMSIFVESHCLCSLLKYYNCPSYNKTAKIILLLQFLWSPVWWPYSIYNLYDDDDVLARYEFVTQNNKRRTVQVLKNYIITFVRDVQKIRYSQTDGSRKQSQHMSNYHPIQITQNTLISLAWSETYLRLIRATTGQKHQRHCILRTCPALFYSICILVLTKQITILSTDQNLKCVIHFNSHSLLVFSSTFLTVRS